LKSSKLIMKIDKAKEWRKGGEDFLISISGAIPRESLIRTFLFTLFPNEIFKIFWEKLVP
jgi:hypothetical protein